MTTSEEPIGEPAHQPPPGWVRRLWAQVWLHRTHVLISFGAAVLGSLGQAAVPLLERQIVDDVIVEARRARCGPGSRCSS